MLPALRSTLAAAALLWAMLALLAAPGRAEDPAPKKAAPKFEPETPKTNLEDLSPDVLKQLEQGLRPVRIPDDDEAQLILPENRTKRNLRWTLTFRTRDGADYARQLEALGAYLGIPGKDGSYRLIRDLKQRPVKAEDVDIKKVERIFWVDDRRESVGPLAQALQLPTTPGHVVAFFPESLEKELLQKEARYRGLKEKDIVETRFSVIRRGEMHVIVVKAQRSKE